MGSTSDFVTATLADAMLPFFRRPVEDVILETLDQRQVPNRTDFKDLRDLVNHLRGQLSGATGGVKKLADAQEELEDRIDELDEQSLRAGALPAAMAPALTQALQAGALDPALEDLAQALTQRLLPLVQAKLLKHLAADLDTRIDTAVTAAVTAAVAGKGTRKPARKKVVRKPR
ncbi:MAG: hypothetical protein GXP62_14140 [Oligoflexia bacterium]|nr:hypothetical protein [Oligoflexia bacterium]